MNIKLEKSFGHIMSSFQKRDEKDRIGFVDLAKGFCIILVLIHHLESEIGVHCGIDPYLRTFRMPLYFLLSGLFFKTYDSFWDFEIRKTNKLLIPFLFFYFLTSVQLTWLQQYEIRKVISWDLPFYFITKEECLNNRPIWFLWCLFINNLLFYLIFLVSGLFPKARIIVLCLLIIFFGSFGYYLGYYDINVPAFIDTSLTALPFFSLGFLLRKYTKFLVPNKCDKYSMLIILFCIFTVYWLTDGDVNYRTNSYTMPIFHVYMSGTLGSLGILYISKVIKWLPIISYLGRYSIMILVSHKILMVPFLWVFNLMNLSKNLSFLFITLLMILSYLIIIPLMKKFLPHVTAQKDLLPVCIHKNSQK